MGEFRDVTLSLLYSVDSNLIDQRVSYIMIVGPIKLGVSSMDFFGFADTCQTNSGHPAVLMKVGQTLTVQYLLCYCPIANVLADRYLLWSDMNKRKQKKHLIG